MEIFKQLNKKGYKHYYEGTIEELDSMDKDNQHLHSEIMQVIMWLYEKHGIWINVWSDTNLNLPEWKDSAKWFYVLNCDLGECYNLQTGKPKNLFNSPTEAYEAGIEYVFTNKETCLTN